MTNDWTTVLDCAKLLDVPEESIHHLVNCGMAHYSVDKEFRTTVRPVQVERLLLANAVARLGGSLEQTAAAQEMPWLARTK